MTTATDDQHVPLILPPDLPECAESFVEVAGYRARIFRMGQGPPLLLLPSAFLRATSYESTVRALAKHFAVTAAEMPGSGASQRVETPWGFDDSADWTEALVKHLKMDRPLLVGHSDSGGTVAVLASRRPDWLRGLVLADSVGARPGATWFTLGLGRLRDGTFEEPRLNLPLTPHMLMDLWNHTRNFLDHAFSLAAGSQPLEVADRIEAPTLIAWGRRDHTFPPACAERFHAAIPNSRIAWSDASHDWLITHPDAFAHEVSQFARQIV